MSDTIAAVSTGSQLSGVGVIRLSGDDAIRIAETVFTPAFGPPMSQRPDRLLVYGSLHDGQGAVLDRCLCTVSRGPHSYTGEDTAELQCHGSPMVLSMGLHVLFAAGARQALAGEFTKRAFLNGCMDLTQAEAVIDLIHAETEEAAKNAAGQLGGAVTRRTDRIYERLRDILSHYYAVVDYPDEGIEPFELRAYTDTLRNAETRLTELLHSFDRGRIMTEGVLTAIVGRPNVGKSSLLNALLGFDRAIVTEIPGTTRDTITERVRLGRVLLRLTDTAGVRDTDNEIERIGVERSHRALREAALLLMLFDVTAGLTQDDRELLRTVQAAQKPYILLPNKIDLGRTVTLGPNLAAVPYVVPISAKTGEGLDRLEQVIGTLFPTPEAASGEILTNARQAEALSRALRSVTAARETIEAGMPPDAVLTEIETALAALGELSGRSVQADITDRIFSRFCVGK